MSFRTPKQVAAEEGVSVRRVRTLIHEKRLAHVMIGARPKIPEGAWERFISENTVQPCRDETLVPVAASAKSEAASTSSGLSTVAAVSAALARETARGLKANSRN